MMSKRSNLICSLAHGHDILELRKGLEVINGIIPSGSFPKFGDCKYFIFNLIEPIDFFEESYGTGRGVRCFY